MQHLKYDLFGAPVPASGTLLVDDFFAGYLGMPWDKDALIYWRGSRPYDPLSGRYLSPSTSGFAGSGGNAYLFENNTPTSRDGSSAQTGYVGGYDGRSFWDDYAYAADPRNDFAQGNNVMGWVKIGVYTWGAAGAAFIGTYLAATAGIAAGASATTAWATAGTGAALGATSGAINTYAHNPDAGFHEYAFGAGIGGAFGAGNVVGSGASLVGGGTGAAIAAGSGNDWRTGYQIGDLAGGMLGGGIDDGIRAYGKFAANGAKGAVRNAVLHGAAHFGVEAGFAGGGAAIGGYATGTMDGALFGANIGSMVGSAAANFLVACFTAKTPILISIDGHAKLAVDVKQGDMLVARDENNPNGSLELKRVEEVFVRQSPVIELVVRGRIIGTTVEHPFFVVRLKRFVPASHIEVGDAFLSHDGQLVVLDAVRNTGEVETVYNFRVADHHTYFVGGKEWGFSIWCHNATYAHLNVNNARSTFGIYDIEVNGTLHKVGKADLSRITQSSGLPTRLHQQLRKLREIHGRENVTGSVVQKLGSTTTRKAKAAETARLQAIFDQTGIVPPGNIKSFRPKES